MAYRSRRSDARLEITYGYQVVLTFDEESALTTGLVF